MQLKIAFLFLVLAFVRAEQEVDEEKCEKKVDECLAAGNRALDELSEENFEEPCRVLKESTQCLEDVMDECYRIIQDPEEQDDLRELEDALREIKQNNARICPGAYSDIHDKIEQCVGNLEDELIECVSDSLAEAMATMIQLSNDDQEPDETEIKCSMYRTVTKCVAKKVKDGCGDEAVQFVLTEMADVSEDIKENCPSPNPRESLKGIMYDIAKRRRK